MLREQIRAWEHYPDSIEITLVDDGSPEDAYSVVQKYASEDLKERMSLYRILVDVPWNREEARNLAATQASTDWLIQVDIDHLLPPESAHELQHFTPNKKYWYKFPRWRKGKADETRKKDKVDPEAEFAAIHPHIDSYLVLRYTYMRVGGYDLAFSGCLGGGSDFLKRLAAYSEFRMLPDNIPLHVYTRSVIKDASDWSLSRDTTEGKRRARKKLTSGKQMESCAVRSPWERQL